MRINFCTNIYHQSFQALEQDNDTKGKVDYSHPHFIEREKESAKLKFNDDILHKEDFDFEPNYGISKKISKKIISEAEKIIKKFKK